MRSESPPAPVVEPGQLIGGKYRIAHHLGSGAMGTVYAAEHEHLGSPAALKFLLPQLARVPVLTQRFLREGKISATLNSPHVVKVTDVDQLPNGIPYLVMERLEGQSLQQYLAKKAPLPVREAVDIATQILSGLRVAHEAGIVHRDLKPDNVFLANTGDQRCAKLLDFGIAKVRAEREFQALTRPGTVMGTPEYMAPEQALSSDTADARSDLYAVGVVLYEMLSGQLPASGSDFQEITNKILTGQVIPLAQHCPALHPDLIQLVTQTLSPDPRERPGSAQELRDKLQHCLRHSESPVVAATAAMPEIPSQSPATTVDLPPTTSQPLDPRGRAWRWLAGIVVLLGFAGALFVAYLRWSAQQSGPAPALPIPKHLEK